MRPVLLSDVDTAVHALLAVPIAERRARIAQIVEAAERADRYLGATGRFHPAYGTGSLSSAARKHGIHPARTVCDADYLAAMRCVLDALIGTETREIPSRP